MHPPPAHVIPARPHTSITLRPRRVPPPHRIHALLWENVLFGRADNEAQFHTVKHAGALMQDLELLPQGDHMESGEQGINLRCALVQCAMN